LHEGSNFFARPFFRQLIAETIGPNLSLTVIEGAVEFKTYNAHATPLHYPLPHPARGLSQ